MTNSFSSTFIFFRILNSLLIFLIIFFVYKKYLKKYLNNLFIADQDIKLRQNNQIKLLQEEHLISEENLKNQAEEIFQIHANMQIWQKKIDHQAKVRKRLQEDLILNLKNQALLKAQNRAFSKNLKKISMELSQDLNFKKQFSDLFVDKKNQEKYLKKSLELMNEQ
jgi:hypothetical protein